jgi:SAM-dependent methyltransferase
VLSDRPVEGMPRRTSRYARIRRRIHAWWEGIELPPEPAEPDPADQPLLLDTEAPPLEERDWPESAQERAKLWPIRRIEAAELIWGRDCILPGGAEYTMQLATPLGLTPALSLLDLAAGLGGGTRGLAESFGVWVTGLERDDDLATEGQDRSKRAKLDKKAPIRRFDPNDFELKKRSFDCMFARESFYAVADKQPFFATLQRGLKDRGQLLFADYLLGPQPPGDAFGKWAEAERQPSYPMQLDELTALLESLNFDCRIAQDDSEVYKTHVMAAWSRIAAELQGGSIPRHLLGRVVEEAERWARFVHVLNAGELRFYRFHAFYRERK